MRALSYVSDAPMFAASTTATVCMSQSDFNKRVIWTGVLTAVLGGMLASAIGGISRAVEERRHPERVQRRLEDELKFLKRRTDRRTHKRS